MVHVETKYNTSQADQDAITQLQERAVSTFAEHDVLAGSGAATYEPFVFNLAEAEAAAAQAAIDAPADPYRLGWYA